MIGKIEPAAGPSAPSSAVPDPREEARLHAGQALLLRDEGRLAAALRLQRRAVDLLGRSGPPEAACEAMVDLAGLAAEHGAPRHVARALRRAGGLLHAGGELRAAALRALRRAALRTAAAGLGREAEALVAAASELWAEALSPAERSRLRWIAGSVARATGRRAEAMKLLRQAWGELCDRGEGEPAAAALLEAASLLAGEGGTEEAAALLDGGLRRLSRLTLRPGAHAALQLAAIALAKEEPPVGLVEELASYLREGVERPSGDATAARHPLPVDAPEE